ncbi:glycoside hydrolase family 18 protein [Thermocatellispora tengchongensis]|uniref:hypothetical protein n=1 Tax=Thermocatellispora tengchongensis TaxID=1073253 RepID=UPI003645413E
MTRPDASPRGAARRGLRLLLRAAAVVLALAGLLAGVTAAALRLQFTGAPASWARSSGHDALWLGHMWVDGRRGERDVAALAARLRDTGIKDVYVHSGPFELDGTLKPEKYPNARNFLKWWRTHLPSVRVSAWLGQEVKDGGLDLDDPANRERVLSGARAILDTGFDGVHYNFEPIGDGDAEFLELLDRTRALAPGRLLTTSVPQTEPYLGMRLLARAVIAHDKYWSRGYLREVARRVDQVAVMTYDAYWPMASCTAATWRARPSWRCTPCPRRPAC